MYSTRLILNVYLKQVVSLNNNSFDDNEKKKMFYGSFVKKFIVVFIVGFTGDFCERDIDECVEQHVVACQPRNTEKCFNLPGSYWCQCKPGFTNQTCWQPQDPCSTHRCTNGATCVATGASEYQCTCKLGFGGRYCETSYSSCNNNFTCPFPNSLCFSSVTGSTTCMCSSDEFTLSYVKLSE